jgi:RimJ/RimL family protein N-acetyltransferase
MLIGYMRVSTGEQNKTGEFVGWFCLFPETEKLAEIGYRLRRDAWGQG